MGADGKVLTRVTLGALSGGDLEREVTISGKKVRLGDHLTAAWGGDLMAEVEKRGAPAVLAELGRAEKVWAQRLKTVATRMEDYDHVYYALLETGAKTDHHESDLYIEDTPAVREVLKKYKLDRQAQPFKDNTDGTPWLDVPFAYLPFWFKKNGSRVPETAEELLSLPMPASVQRIRSAALLSGRLPIQARPAPTATRLSAAKALAKRLLAAGGKSDWVDRSTNEGGGFGTGEDIFEFLAPAGNVIGRIQHDKPEMENGKKVSWSDQWGWSIRRGPRNANGKARSKRDAMAIVEDPDKNSQLAIRSSALRGTKFSDLPVLDVEAPGEDSNEPKTADPAIHPQNGSNRPV